jgi:hypothetical protein
VHTTVVSALLSRAQLGGMNLLVLTLCLVSTLVAFVLLFPLMSLTNIVGMSAGGRGVHALRRAGHLVGRYGMTKMAVENGERDADLVGSNGSGKEADFGGSGSESTRSGHHRRINLPAESFGRPEQWSEPRNVRVAAGTSIGRGPVPVAALSAGPSAGGSRPRPSSTSNVMTRNLVPIEGVVVHHPPSRMPEATVVHDSETIIASDGVGPRLFDPATKSSVRIDRNGNVIDEDREP